MIAAAAPGDTINFDLGITSLSVPTIQINKELNIEGYGAGTAGVQFAYNFCPFSIGSMAHVNIFNLSFEGNFLRSDRPCAAVLRLEIANATRASIVVGCEFSVEEIAHRVGYRDAFYFSRLFKAHFGQSPKKYQDIAANT